MDVILDDIKVNLYGIDCEFCGLCYLLKLSNSGLL